MDENIIGIIGGSGLGDILAQRLSDFTVEEADTPFGRPSAPVMIGRLAHNTVAFINRHGAGHKLSPSDVPYAANIFALKKLGVRTLIASAAVGSLQEHIASRDLVLVDQFIDKTHRRQSSFFNGVAAVHCEMAQPVCSRVRKIFAEAAEQINLTTHTAGTYVCMEGPQFSTRAESLMHRQWGGHLIGMTAMPEAKLAREAQMCYCLVALVSDYDCWRPQKANNDKQTLLKEIIGNLDAATSNAVRLIEAVLERRHDLLRQDCPCRKSLELAMWTAQSRISPEEKERLAVLFE